MNFMKSTFYNFVIFGILVGFHFNAHSQLIITAVYDGPLSGGTPKGVELYVSSDISDLSMYGLGSANNGGGTDGQEFTFPNVTATAGDFIYVATEAIQFTNYFGFAPDYTSIFMAINGDDAIELFGNGSVIDVYGEPGNTNESAWDYEDGWAYRVSNTTADGSVFNLANWSLSGINALDGCSSNSTCSSVIPVGTFSLAPMPVELIDFNLRPSNAAVVLNWSTASEQDNDHFRLERAGADRAFELIAKVYAAVNSTALNTYSFSDESPLDGLNYYRLVQVDLDGTMNYYNILSYDGGVKTELSLYPNPVKNQLVIETSDMIGAVLEIRDLSGRIIEKSIVSNQIEELSMGNLRAGVYILFVEHKGICHNERLIKL
jgi:hypothetical protein